MNVRWTEPARRHLIAIHAYIAESSPMQAQRMADRLTRRAEQVGDFPRSGRLIRGLEELEIREIFEGSYRIVYVVARDHVEILGVVHGRRYFP